MIVFFWVLLENRCRFFNDFQNPLLVNVHRLPLLHLDSVDQYAHFPYLKIAGNGAEADIAHCLQILRSHSPVIRDLFRGPDKSSTSASQEFKFLIRARGTLDRIIEF